MSDSRVTKDNNPELWQQLKNIWESEKHPGWVVSRNLTWTVIQQTDGEVAFIPYNAENMYDSTSFV